MRKEITIEQIAHRILGLVRHRTGSELTMTYDEAFDLLLQAMRLAQVKGEEDGLLAASNVLVTHLSACPARYTSSLLCTCGATSKRTEMETRS